MMKLFLSAVFFVVLVSIAQADLGSLIFGSSEPETTCRKMALEHATSKELSTVFLVVTKCDPYPRDSSIDEDYVQFSYVTKDAQNKLMECMAIRATKSKRLIPSTGECVHRKNG